MKGNKNLGCLVCNEPDTDFLTRCNHKYHLACLSKWIEDNNDDDCISCGNTVSDIELVEDMRAKREVNIESFLEGNPSKEIYQEAVIEAILCGNLQILRKLFENDRKRIDTNNLLATAAYSYSGGKKEIIKYLIQNALPSALHEADPHTPDGILRIALYLSDSDFPCDIEGTVLFLEKMFHR